MRTGCISCRSMSARFLADPRVQARLHRPTAAHGITQPSARWLLLPMGPPRSQAVNQTRACVIRRSAATPGSPAIEPARRAIPTAVTCAIILLPGTVSTASYNLVTWTILWNSQHRYPLPHLASPGINQPNKPWSPPLCARGRIPDLQACRPGTYSSTPQTRSGPPRHPRRRSPFYTCNRQRQILTDQLDPVHTFTQPGLRSSINPAIPPRLAVALRCTSGHPDSSKCYQGVPAPTFRRSLPLLLRRQAGSRGLSATGYRLGDRRRTTSRTLALHRSLKAFSRKSKPVGCWEGPVLNGLEIAAGWCNKRMNRQPCTLCVKGASPRQPPAPAAATQPPLPRERQPH